jgi:hypothetical protein
MRVCLAKFCKNWASVRTRAVLRNGIYRKPEKKGLWICYHMAAMCSNKPSSITYGPITVAVRYKAWNVFARSNTGVVGSSPSQGMDACVRLFCVSVR